MNGGAIRDILQRPDGTYVAMGMDSSLFARMTLGSDWQGIPNSIGMISIAQLAYGVILGVDTDHQLFTRPAPTSPWIQVV